METAGASRSRGKDIMNHRENVNTFRKQLEKAIQAVINEAFTQGVELVVSTFDLEDDAKKLFPQDAWKASESAIMADNAAIEALVIRYDVFTRNCHADAECEDDEYDEVFDQVEKES